LTVYNTNNYMKKILISITFATLCLLYSSCSKEQLQNIIKNVPGISNEDAIAALKEALSISTDTSVSILNKLDGYYKDEAVKILLPQEAQVIYSNLSKVPGGNQLLENTILTMNRAAEDAASEAKPIFINAITSMTIQDGMAIIEGSDTAATAYLHQKTYSSLYTAFQPKINQSLSKPIVLGISAESAYQNLINAYNTASLGGVLWPQINTNGLSAHVTAKGLNGLFLKVSEQEKEIRNDPLAQVTDLLKKVFGRK
jgi:hypothetical protein